MDPAGAAPIEVFVFRDGQFLGSRCYSQGAVIVGSGRSAALKLNDRNVSEQHAIIRQEGTSVVLSDNGSSTGVYVNGERIGVSRIRSIDEVTIGPFRLKVTLLGHQEEEQDTGFGTPAPAPALDHPEHARGRTALPDDEGETVVRVGAERLTGCPRDPDLEYRQMEEATLPRIVKPRHRAATKPEDPFERYDELAPRAAPDLDPRHARAAVLDAGATDRMASFPDEPPTRSEIPSGIERDEGFEDFSRGRRRSSGQRRKQRVQAAAPRAITTREEALEPPKPLPEEPLPEEPLPQGESALFDSSASEAYDQEVLEPELPAPSDPDEDGAGDDEDDEDDEDDAAFVEPFSLLENIVRERFKSKVQTEPFTIVEVIQYDGGEIRDLLRANPGKRVRVGMDRFNLVTLEKDGRASVYFRKDFKGTLVSRGKARPIKAFCTSKFQANQRGDLFAVSLAEGDYAQVIRGNQGYLVRFVRPPTIPKAPLRMRMNWSGLQIFVGSAAFHFLILVMLGFVAPEADLTVAAQTERFAKLATKDLELEKPQEKKKEEEEKPEQPEKPKDEAKPKPKPKPKQRARTPQRRIARRAEREQATVEQQRKVQQKQVSNVLSALENIRPSGGGPGRSNLQNLTSNIKAVRVPGGTSGGFKVAGTIGKIPGGGVRLAGGLGGGGGKDTRVGSQLLGGGSKIGGLKATEGTGGKVRGRVRKAPTRAIQASGGVLDRGAIQKVVNQHMAAIQRCYETQLLQNPGLAGKVVFDWVIAPSGGVASARQVSSSMRSPAVASCILAQIRTWRFPSPVGGSVQVRYPFVFRIQGF